MAENQVLLSVVLLNILVAMVYLFIMKKRNRLVQGCLSAGIMLLVPIYGVVLILISDLMYRVLKHTKAAHIDLEELSFSKEKKRIIESDDIQRGLNKVPIEEALLESDNVSTRRVLLDVLKVDFESSIPILIKAIESDDSEVSHYASAAISDVLSKFKKRQKEIEEQYRKHDTDEELLALYRKYVYKYLRYNIFPETEKEYYMNLYEELQENAYANFRKTLEIKDYENWICLLLENKKQKNAKLWLDRMKMRFPEMLETYKTELQYSFKYDSENFKACIGRIKKSQVVLDEETLELIRFFQLS